MWPDLLAVTACFALLLHGLRAVAPSRHLYYTIAHLVLATLTCVFAWGDGTSATVLHVGFYAAVMLVDRAAMRAVDWVHHLFSSVLMGLLGLHYAPGPVLNLAAFYGVGAGGVVNDVLRLLRVAGAVRHSEALAIDNSVELWVRCPGLLHAATRMPAAAGVCVAANALYFVRHMADRRPPPGEPPRAWARWAELLPPAAFVVAWLTAAPSPGA